MHNETGLQKAQRINREKRANGEKVIRLTPLEKAKQNPRSLRLALNAKCFDCTGGQVTEIRECPVKDCPLFNLRPYQDYLKRK